LSEKFDKESAHSCVLKWWRRDEKGQYQEDSMANNPHTAEVTVALSNPQQESMFVTASLDGTFKLWDQMLLPGAADGESSNGANGASAQYCWHCVASGSWRRQPILTGCFSADGSVFAAGVSGFIILFEAESGAEVKTLPLQEVGDLPGQLCCAVACERFMLLASVKKQKGEEILCWDLASLQVVARLDLGAALKGTGSCCIRCALPASSAGPLQLLAFRHAEAELMTWRLQPEKGALSFQEEASAALPSRHGVLDATFVSDDSTDDGCHLLCWTTMMELWDMDLKVKAGEKGEQQADAEMEEDATPGRGSLGGLIAGRTAAASIGGQRKLLNLPLRTTAAQQAGLVPRLVQRVVPPNVPSHLLPPPAVLWSSLLSVYAKPPDGVQQASPLPDTTEAPIAAPVAAKSNEAALPSPSWVRQSTSKPTEAELVDANFMDELVTGALTKSK